MKYLFILLFVSTVFPSQIKAQNKQQFFDVEFLTKDNVTIRASYHVSTVNKKSPAIILIHQGGSSREEWLGLPIVQQLIKKGYAILAYDVRLHGKSDKDKGSKYDLYNNPKRAPLDLLAAITFLKKDKQIDNERIGIIGASIGANLACVAASNNYNVKSVVVISAKTSAAQNLSGIETTIAPKNAFYIASKNEQNGLRDKWAKELYTLTTGAKKVEIAAGNKHGSYILKEHEYLHKLIIDWFQENL